MALKGYGKYETSAADAEQAELDKVFGQKIIKLQVGRTTVRLLPPAEGRNTPFKMIYMHFVDLPASDKPEVFPCPRRNANRPCPVCAKAEEMRVSGNEVQVEKAKRLFPKRQWYANAVNRGQIEEGVQLIACGQEIMKQIVAARKTLMEDGIDLTDPYEGVDLVITRTGTKRDDTEYAVTARAKTSPLGESDEQMQEWIDTMTNLETKAIPPTTEEIMQRLRGERSSASGSGGGESNAPKVRGEGPSQRSIRTAEDDAEDPDYESPSDRDAASSGGNDEEVAW